MSSNQFTELPSIVTVLFDFSGENEGEHIEMKKGELLTIVKKVNNDWWQVKRLNGCPNGNLETNDALVIENRQQIDEENINGNNNDMFYAPVSYLREMNCNEQINLPNNKHKTTIKVGLCFTNPLSSGFSTDDTLSEDDQLDDSRDSSKESLIDDMNGNEIIKSKNSCDKSMKSNLITKSPPSPPIYSNLRIMKSRHSPPVPIPGLSPIRILLNHWAEYQDENGRKYYYNSLSRECSWKPPRRKTFDYRDDEATSHSEENLTDSSSCASLSIHNNNKLSSSSTSNSFKSKLKFKKPIKLNKKESSNSKSTNNKICSPTNNQCSVPQLPKGWTRKYNAETRELYFVNENTKQKWFCKLDENGRLYFFEENGQESYWELPELTNNDEENENTPQTSESVMEDSGIAYSGESNDSISSNTSNLKNKLQIKSSFQKCSLERSIKSRSMAVLPIANSQSTGNPSIPEVLLLEKSEKDSNLPIYHPPPNCLDESVKIIKQGILNRTKLVEGGKRIRKNWSTNYIVSTDLYLLFFKDAKTANSGGKPDFFIELAGAMLTWSPEKSSKKNCFQISTVTGFQVLLQEDCPITCKEWHDLIKNAINKLPSSFHNEESDKDANDKSDVKLKRSRSTKQYRRRDENEVDQFVPLSVSQSATNIPPDRKKKIRERLRQFLRRRPTLESLREKGIFKDEPVFGGKLEHLCLKDKTLVPKFVQQCIKAIEDKDLKADGLYRACGNLSQVQKLRYQINQDDYGSIWAEDDVHVLTGLLKMFFRELKDPLFPCNRFEALMKIIVLPDRKSKLEALTKLIKVLPRPNYETLKFLLQHLLRVKEHSKDNRMHIQNLAIVFGPTLMWPENDSNNFALDMMLRMHQNQIIEFLLLEFSNMFN